MRHMTRVSATDIKKYCYRWKRN